MLQVWNWQVFSKQPTNGYCLGMQSSLSDSFSSGSTDLGNPSADDVTSLNKPAANKPQSHKNKQRLASASPLSWKKRRVLFCENQNHLQDLFFHRQKRTQRRNNAARLGECMISFRISFAFYPSRCCHTYSKLPSITLWGHLSTGHSDSRGTQPTFGKPVREILKENG